MKVRTSREVSTSKKRHPKKEVLGETLLPVSEAALPGVEGIVL
jgi:hypothetical protein